ncbi:MAG: NUDIX domain-containing protein [Patescibacteria group bacterium]
MAKPAIDKLAWIEIQDRKVLVTRTRGKDAWYMPGGKRQGDESDQAALLREIQEELSVALDLRSLAHYGTFEGQAHGQPPGTIARLTCYTGTYKGTLSPSNEIEEINYAPYSMRPQIGRAGQLVFDNLKAKNLID